jgi:hypothetical protein
MSDEKKINVRLLRRVQKAIVEHAAHFDMNDWGVDVEKSQVFHDEPSESECGTAACIGGFAVLLSDGRNPPLRSNVAKRAAELLGLSYSVLHDELNGNRLFYVDRWPAKFSGRHRRAKRNLTRARIAAERIEHFIRTKGAE